MLDRHGLGVQCCVRGVIHSGCSASQDPVIVQRNTLQLARWKLVIDVRDVHRAAARRLPTTPERDAGAPINAPVHEWRRLRGGAPAV
eukprot:1375724-Prymnesium_polylepis.1